MSLATWKRLAELEAVINADFSNLDVPKEGCPPLPRVHLVHAHYVARPNVDRNVAALWYFATLKQYKACSEPRHLNPALDYLAAHYLWVLLKDVKIVKLPVPPTKLPIAPTGVDGGTLVHFDNTNFVDPEAVKATITTPLLIQDPLLLEKYGEVVTEVAHPPPGKDPPPLKPAAAQAASAAPAAPERSTGDVDTGPRYPKLRRLCLSLVGQKGDHTVVDATPGTATVDLAYHTPQQDTELRLFCVAPGFDFVLKGGKAKAREAAQKKAKSTGAEQKATAVLGAQDDPWVKSTRDLGSGKQLWESTSNVFVGDLVHSSYGDGIQKLASAPGVTTTDDLGKRYQGKLGRSRQLVFKAVKDIEGGCESIQTWDGDKISWGINQWTLPTDTAGELYQILAFIYDFFPDAFARRFGYFGMGVWFSGRAATFDPRNTYRDVVVYRVPCCGQKIRDGIRAILDESLKAKFVTGTDTPPLPLKPLADVMRIRRADTATVAMCYAFTTAGEDHEIQKAMAQWMSYRITTTGPVRKTMLIAVGEFLKSLGASADAAVRDAKSILGLGPEHVAKAAAEAHKEVPKEPAGTYAKRLLLATADKVKPQIQALLDESFTDADADLGWIDWPTRCKDAGKVTTGVQRGDGRVARTQRKASPKKGRA